MAGFDAGRRPPAGRPDRDARRFQISPDGLAPDPRFLLDAPEWPAEPPQRDDLVTFFFVQDIAHVDGGYPPSQSMYCLSSVGRF